MFEKVPSDPALVSSEHEVLKLWRDEDTFNKLRDLRKDGEPWSFLDGPITANNPMGVHHAWGRAYKDAFQRFFAMNGHNLRWQNGFDCQGLWVEVQVERDLGFKSKKDIEEYGLENFIEKCKERVHKFADVITQQSVRLGMWMDWDNSYYTMSDENNYTIWAFLKKCHERGLVYKGLDSMPWCPRCGTGISEQERKDGYKEVTDRALYARLPLQGKTDEYLLVWTTTPWTLPANVAAAVNPDLEYVRAKVDESFYYVTKDRLEVLGPGAQITSSVRGSEMVGWKYQGPFDEIPAAREAALVHRVIPWDEVSAVEGTGIVHIAPGCGKEDFELSKEFDFPVIAPIDETGVFVDGFGPLTGSYAGDVGDAVRESLTSKDLFFAEESYTHDYPHCWRCDTPLLFRAVDEWYINMSWRDEIRKVVRQARWIPDHGEAQELDWLLNMGDWMISKKRYWGLALPIWECAGCGHFDVIGGREELEARAVEGWDSFDGHTPHRPWVDSVKIACPKCGGVASRIVDVGNPWLDAGIVAYSTTGYNEDRTEWARWIPANLVVESFPGQFRNWFYSLLAMSAMMEGIPPFKTLLGHALVRDEKGDEFSKSKYMIEFNEAAEKVGADVLRWLYCRQLPTSNLNFSWTATDVITRKVFGTLWNSYLFFCNYARLDRFDPSSPAPEVSSRPSIDRWILSELAGLVAQAHEDFRNFWLPPFIKRAEEFIDDLSNWYIRRSRQRFWNPRSKDEQDKMAAYHTLYTVLVTFTKLLAPILPFLTERMHNNLMRGVGSVHLADYPQVDQSLIDKDLSERMKTVRVVTGAARALREEAGIRVRQPLQTLRVSAGSTAPDAILREADLLKNELNVKDVLVEKDLSDLVTLSVSPNFRSLGPKFGKRAPEAADALRSLSSIEADTLRRGETVISSAFEFGPDDATVKFNTRQGWAVANEGDLTIALDLSLTPELEREGIARDIVRQVQQMRREAGLNIEDRIFTTWSSGDDIVVSAIDEWNSYISTETQSDTFDRSDSADGLTDVVVGESKIRLGLQKST